MRSALILPLIFLWMLLPNSSTAQHILNPDNIPVGGAENTTSYKRALEQSDEDILAELDKTYQIGDIIEIAPDTDKLTELPDKDDNLTSQKSTSTSKPTASGSYRNASATKQKRQRLNIFSKRPKQKNNKRHRGSMKCYKF